MDFVYHHLIHLKGDPQERPWQAQLTLREGRGSWTAQQTSTKPLS